MIQSFTCFDWHQEWKRYVYITDAKAESACTQHEIKKTASHIET